ncbi:apolipoprotein N-acyltransferase [Mariniblastus fucicola]|uniref:Apolipoprotein N-acyltransferase n=1 Tax=Mariniblastus fucicola TaxID=980251 RepID=A0A5B9P6J0_9BACT|nr:apolipoprotein N-acyltransferase [Mariniblastus fucicola]QEG21159.1 Apolipoprotein N-acyltransferase [Mariniblastus fucicola]
MAKRRKRKKKQERSKNRGSESSAADSLAASSSTRRDFTALFFSLLSSAMLWLAMPGPGRGIYSLAWIAMVPTVWLIQSPILPHKLLRQVWIANLVFWLVMLHFVRLPIWLLWFGWFALAAYLSVYGPLFVSISRTLVHRFRVPTVVAVPLVFTGLEWVRVNFLSGFGIGCLSHTQYRNPTSMQIAEFFGAYGITFAIMFVAAAVSVASSFACRRLSASPTVPTRFAHVAIAVVALAGVFVFGSQRLAKDAQLRKSAEAHKHLKVALIQTSMDTILKPKTAEEVHQEFLTRGELTHSARLIAKDLDLIVWPESSFPYGLVLSDLDANYTAELFAEQQMLAWESATGYPNLFNDAVPLLVGSRTSDPQADVDYNSALLFDDRGKVSVAYHKNHLVMFGEYFPVVRWIPYLKDFLKGFSSWTAGTESVRMQIGDVAIAPSICFESTVPHFVRQQINSLESANEQVDAMVNVTNDGWFFGTSCLDLHLACNVLRAVEMRKPMLVSANTGFSAHIDEFGRLVEVGPRRQEATLICDVRVPLPTTTLYRSWGAWFAFALGWLTVVAGLAGRFLPLKD